jgi:hypothetical protein
MSSITVKLISIACVLAVLLTGMQVMTVEVVASGEEGNWGLVTDPSAKKRITMSESSTRDPATVTYEGFTHLVWIDSSENGEKVCWKKTGGDGVYTSTELLSPRFERIGTLDISANGGTLVVVYVALTNGTTSTYIVCSSDSGQSWGKNYVLGEGSAAAVSVLSDRAYVCIATKLDGNDTVIVIQVDIKDGEPSNGTTLLALPFEASLVDVLADEAGVHYAAAADDPRVVIYGHIGEEFSEPVMIHSQSSGAIDDVELMSSGGNASALIASNLPGGSLIFLAESFDGPEHWSESVLVNGEGLFSDLSYAMYDNAVIVAWANSSSPGAIEALELRGGQAVRTWKVIEGAVSSPSVFVENDGISCTWSEDDGYGTELYSLSNIQFRAASFDQVLSYAAGLDEAAFRPDVTDAREHLLDDLENVSAYIRLGDVEGAEDAIVHVMEHIDGFVVLSQSDDLLLSTSACENIFGKLQAVRNDIRSDGLHSDPFAQWAVALPAEHDAVPAMAAFDSGASRSLATLEGCTNVMSVSGEPGGDAPDTPSGALTVEPGCFTGSVNSSDTVDFFKFKVYNPPYHNQMIYIDLDVPSGFDLDMKLYTSSGTLLRTAELGTGEDEHIEFLTPYEGYHYIKIYWYSGSGTANYEVKLEVAGGLDYFYLDVGESGDTTVTLPGLSILDGSGWSSPSNSKRTGSSNSTMLLNLFSASYQSNTSYLVGFQYTASSEVTVSVYNGGGWVDIDSLPGRSTIWVANIIVPSEHLYDALPEVAGMNVMIRFSSSIALDFVDAVAYSYTTGAAPGTSYHNPGVGFESGWTFDGAVANGTAGATILVNVPVQTMIFSLEIAYSGPEEYIAVQQLYFDGYMTIGNLYRWDGSAVISLQRGLYYDADASAPGYNIRLRFVSSISNVTSVTMRPCDLYTAVGGVYDDSGRYRNPGINIYNNGHWSSAASDGGRSYRSTTDSSALFFVNGAVSGNFHEVEIVYRSSSSFVVSQWTGSSFIDVATMPANAFWATASFRIDPSNFVDYMWGTQLNILFRIGTASVSVAELHLLIDSDNDGAVDRMEADRTAGRYLDPFSDDTDSDGLNDIDEGYFGTIYGHTSPWDPDSDDDGLLDGAERWSQSWSTESMKKINGGTGGGYTSNNVYLSLPAIPSTASATITAIWVHVGLMHQHPDQIRVVIYKGGDSSNNHLMDRTGTGTSVFRSWNLFDLGYDASDLASVSEWGLYIDDWSSTGGQLQYYIVQVEGKTDPLVRDTDGDGLWDGEEVNLGEDGWITNPVVKDTDQDTIWDYDETHANTPCNLPTDPTYADTDGDGFWDNVDRALGDMVVRISIDQFKLMDTLIHRILGIPVLSESNPWIFFTISVNGYFYSTERERCQTGATHYFDDRHYYVDVYDTNSSVTVTINAWADDPFYPDDDRLLDIGPSSTYSLVYNFDLASGDPDVTVTSDGAADGGEDDGQVAVTFLRLVQPRTNTVIVNGTDDGEGYGLYKVDDEYRYQCDDQVYILYLDCTNSYGHFTSGMNTVVLPRSVAVSSRLNDILSGTVGLDGTALDGATVYSRDPNLISSSSSIIAIISMSGITGQQAEDLLTLATFSSTNDRVGNAMTVPSGNLYLMHLPKDVLYSMPLEDFDNSPTAGVPNTWAMTFFNTVVTVADFMYHALIDRQFIGNLVTTVVVLGLHKIAEMIDTVSSVVIEAVNQIVNAFQAFVTWAVEFIESVVNELFAPIVSGIQQMGEQYYGRVAAACSDILSDIQSIGSISERSKVELAKALLGDLFVLVAGITMLIVVAMTVLSVVTGPFGFLTTFVISVVVSLIVETALQAALATMNYVVDAGATLYQVVSGLFSWSGESIDENDLVSTLVDGIISMFEAYGIMFVLVCPGLTSAEKNIARDVALAVTGLFLAVFSVGLVNEDVAHVIDLVALVMAGGALLYSVIDLIEVMKMPNSSPKIVLGICTAISGVGCVKSVIDVKGNYYG